MSNCCTVKFVLLIYPSNIFEDFFFKSVQYVQYYIK
jgi:hypothetical protein